MTHVDQASPAEPRGLRLNNPGNIRHNPKNKWFGASTDQPDKEFVKFDAMEHGVRALARVLISYEKAGANTVEEIINRWAPPSENDTAAYIDHVAALLQVDPTEEIDIDSGERMFPLIRAIMAHENGSAAARRVKDKTVLAGMRAAGVHGTPKQGLLERGGFKTNAVATVTAGTAAVASLSEPVKKVADGLEPFQGSPLIMNLTVGLITIAGIAAAIGLVGTMLKAKRGL